MTRYRYAAGRPRQGIHARRIPLLDWALWDVVGTVVVAVILSRWLRRPPWLVAGGLFLLSVVVHLLLGVPTAVVERWITKRA